MKVKDLLVAIKDGNKRYEDFLEWDVAVESHEGTEGECSNCKESILKDIEGTSYIKCHGFNTFMPKKKAFSVNIHY